MFETMPPRTLPIEAWLIVAAIAWVTVRQCVKVLERHVSHGHRFRTLIRDVQRLRDARTRKLQEPALRARAAAPPRRPVVVDFDADEPPAAAA